MKNAPPLRADGRRPGESRPFTLELDFTLHAEGSVLASAGNTKVLCTASVEDQIPGWMKNQGRGWVTAEYAMLPRATHTRSPREITSGKPSGRGQEIQRLIGRSLRSVVNLEALGTHTIWIDCDVIQADGGTRTTAIAGGFVALVLALRKLGQAHPFPAPPVTGYLSSVSVGVVDGQTLLDLDYGEDSRAEVDLNLVLTDSLEIIEIQGNAEGHPFPRKSLAAMLDLAEAGVQARLEVQKKALGGRLA